MTVKLLRQDTTGIFYPEGSLDSTTSDSVHKVILQSVEDNGFTTVVIDMTDVRYVSSAGLRVLKMMHISFEKSGKTLFLRNIKPLVMDVFQMTGLAGLFHIESGT